MKRTIFLTPTAVMSGRIDHTESTADQAVAAFCDRGKREEFAGWIEEVRGVKVRVINRAGSRPVPLRAAFIAPDLRLFPLVDETGKFNPELEQFTRRRDNNNRSFRERRRR
jgi:hypothetical protein